MLGPMPAGTAITYRKLSEEAEERAVWASKWGHFSRASCTMVAHQTSTARTHFDHLLNCVACHL